MSSPFGRNSATALVAIVAHLRALGPNMGIGPRKCKATEPLRRRGRLRSKRLSATPSDPAAHTTTATFGPTKPPAANRPPYLSWVEIELKVDFSFVPRFDTTAMIASEIPAAISPYSMAVAADSSFKKRTRVFFKAGLPKVA